MSKKHDAVFDDILGGMEPGRGAPPRTGGAGARFLQRSNRVADRLSGEVEEKTLRWVDPAECRMWARHNRAYDLLTEDNCRDLIDGIRSQGRQEFPAVVRRTGDGDQPYEVVAGARRHFAITWLRANNYPQFRYLVDVRDLTDEEAFRLSDVENRDRADISDYERAMDYLDAIERYYGGSQREMAERLEMSPAYLSRFLQLAKLPGEIVGAFANVRDVREAHARKLKPHLGRAEARARVVAEAEAIAAEGRAPDGNEVMTRLLAAAKPRHGNKREPEVLRIADDKVGLTVRRAKGKVVLEYPTTLRHQTLVHLFNAFLKAETARREGR